MDYEKAIELYSSASRILRDEKYPTKKIAEIIEISNLNKKFFNDFLNIQKDSLKLDKLYFNKHLSLKIIKTNNGSKFTIDENGDEIELFDDSIYNLEKPWENLDWNVSNSCFLKNEKVYNQIQILVTKHYFKFLELLKIEEVNTNGNYYELNFYNKSTFLDHIINGKKAYNLAKSLIELEILKTEIKKLQEENKKKIIFKKFQIVSNEFDLKLKTNSELETNRELISEMKLFSEKIASLYSQETKEIEKKLKPLENSDLIKSLILEK